MQFLIVGNPDNRRVQLFELALAEFGLAPAIIVSWSELLSGDGGLADTVERCDMLRIESPGQDFEVFRRLVARGAQGHRGDSFLTTSKALALKEDFGRIRLGRQWYAGFGSALEQIDDAVSSARRPPRVMNATDDIAVMFDKPRCQRRLADAGVRTPPMLGTPGCYEELRELMGQRGVNRVFIKPAHGSSAAGVLAYRVAGGREQVTTSARLVETLRQPLLYNSLDIQQYSRRREVRQVIDCVLAERAIVEVWLPKASAQEHTFDIRLLVIDDSAAHGVLRLSKHPMTNLHLGNRRGDLGAFVEQIGEARWAEACRVAERAAAAFPGSLYVGVDLLFDTSKGVAVCEVNAFGDLLPRVMWRGMSTYAAEIEAVVRSSGAPSAS